MEEKRELNLRGELEFLQYLQEESFPAMKPVASREGKLLVILHTEWGEYYASVFEGVQGKPIEDTDYESRIMLSYGRTLGKLHRLSMDYEPVCRKWTYKEVLSWIKAVLKQYNAKKTALEEVEVVEQGLALIPENQENFGLVHYDFEPDNVFYHEESDECFVIDFEDGMYHFFLVDIEQVLDALTEEMSGEELLRAKEYFIQGYRSEKAIEPEYEAQLPLMRRFCNLYAYARLIRCISERMEEEPEWMCNLRGILKKKISFLEKSFECK